MSEFTGVHREVMKDGAIKHVLIRAAHYRVQVAPSDGFEALVMDTVVDGTQATLPSLPDGAHAFSMGNVDDVLKARFQSFAQMKSNLPDGASFSTTYQSWSDTNRDTIAGTLKAANLTAEQFSSEESTMSQLRSMSESADGQMKALQVGHEIAAQQVAQMQKLRGLVSQQMTMMGTWYQSEQARRDLAQARRGFKAAEAQKNQPDATDRQDHHGDPHPDNREYALHDIGLKTVSPRHLPHPE